MPMRDISDSYIGAMCAEYRRYILHKPQRMVAKDVGVSRELVSAFETGRQPNSRIFLYYIKMGIFDWVPIEKWNGWNLGFTG